MMIMWRVVNGIMLVMIPLIVISFIYDWYYEKPMGISALMLSLVGCVDLMKDCFGIAKGVDHAHHD